MKSLRSRQWPEKSTVIPKDYNPFVKEGFVINRALRLHQSLSEAIPPGECAITSLCTGGNNKIYGATSGSKCHLFYYDPSPGADRVCDIAVLEGARGVRKTLVSSGGTIFGGISEGESGYLFRYETGKDLINDYNTACGSVENLGSPVSGEFIAALAADKIRGVVYGLTSPGGFFFTYEDRKKRFRVKEPVDKSGPCSPTLVVTPSGAVFGAGPCGRLWCYDPDRDTREELPLQIPTLAGRALYNQLESAVYNPFDQRIYGGNTDGLLFAFHPETGLVQTIGKITPETGCPALAVGNDGRIYGINGEREGMAHLFEYNVVTSSLKDLGIPLAASEVFWHGYEFACACTGPSGEVYLGENDRISHLFIYFPVIQASRLSDTV